MRTTIFLTTLYLVFGFFACKKDDESQMAHPIDWTNRIEQLHQSNQSRIKINEGVAGTVTEKSGNCMPPVGPECKEYPVIRLVHIYDLTSGSQVQKDGKQQIIRVNTRKIATISTDHEGFFQYRLPPGSYSLFVEDNGILWPFSTEASNPEQYGRADVRSGRVVVANTMINKAIY